MGYSRQHNLTWDDFQCDGFFAEDLNVGFICESNTTEGKLETSKNFIILRPTKIPS